MEVIFKLVCALLHRKRQENIKHFGMGAYGRCRNDCNRRWTQ